MKHNTSIRLRYFTKIAVLAAISVIIMLLEFGLPFAPGFYELDLSEAVILMGGFAMGPLAAVLIELIKILLNLLINGTITMGVGEAANFIIGCSLVLPASLIYKYKKNIKGALTGLIVGVFSLVVVGAIMNYFVLIPAYVYFNSNWTLDAIVGMGKSVNPFVKDLQTLIIFATVPFNLIKGVVCSVLSLLLYKRISKILHF